MEIRKAVMEDIPRIMEVFDSAKIYMAKNGNPGQWHDGYPWQDVVEEDINGGNCYVIENQGIVHGTFAFFTGIDPTYIEMKEGHWLNENPYGTIHRVASDGTIRGVLHMALEYCKKLVDNIRIDTHENNKIMQNLLAGEGFSYCGIIKTHDGTDRLAYARDYSA